VPYIIIEGVGLSCTLARVLAYVAELVCAGLGRRGGSQGGFYGTAVLKLPFTRPTADGKIEASKEVLGFRL